MVRETALLVPMAFLLDLALGDPRWLPHPVVGIGRVISSLEKRLRRPGAPPGVQRLAGTLLVALVVAGTYLSTALVTSWAAKLWRPIGWLVETVLLYTALAVRSLDEHVRAVERPLAAGDLPVARQALALVVGRDTEQLDPREVARAALETVAENASDGIIAPLFYAFLGGAPLALAYKAVNTLDSMLGYKNERYLHFGWAAARLDDLANYLPARLTALLLVAAGALRNLNARRGLATVRRDARRHESPNSGYPEAALAGLLGIELGGLNYYQGVPSPHALLNAGGAAPAAGDIARARAVVRLAAWLGLGVGILVTYLVTSV